MEIIKLDRKNFDTVLKLACNALRLGKVIVFPTDTLYGLGASALNLRAVKKIYRIKQRSQKNPIHVIVPSIRYAEQIVKINKLAHRIAKKYLPGALTLVLPLKSRAKTLKQLSTGTKYLGIRMPDSDFCLKLAAMFKAPITATSANLSGQRNHYDAKSIAGQFKNNKFKPDIIIDAGRLKKVQASTVVKITADKIEIIRPGPVKISKINS